MNENNKIVKIDNGFLSKVDKTFEITNKLLKSFSPVTIYYITPWPLFANGVNSLVLSKLERKVDFSVYSNANELTRAIKKAFEKGTNIDLLIAESYYTDSNIYDLSLELRKICLDYSKKLPILVISCYNKNSEAIKKSLDAKSIDKYLGQETEIFDLFKCIHSLI